MSNLSAALRGIDHLRNAPPLRAVIYLRVSTEEQAKGYGIAYTEKRALAYIAKRGWEHVETFPDEGVSGALEAHDRPRLKLLMELARQTPRPFDVVVVPESRAIGRTDRAFWRWVWALQDLGIFVADAKRNIDNTTEAGQDAMREEADYAIKERKRIRDRTQGGIQEKAEMGGWPGGRPPYGWRIENKGVKAASRAVRDEAEHAVLKRAWELLVLESKNSRGAALVLNSEGLLTREGKLWSDRNLLNKLRSEAVQHARVTFRKAGRAKIGPDGQPVYGDTVAIPLEPAFSDDELARLNTALSRLEVKRDTQGAPVYPLTKRVIGLCGGHYTGFRRFDVRGYRCSGKLEKYAGAGRCECQLLNADAIENAVWERVCGLLTDADKLRQTAEDWAGLAAHRGISHAERLAELDRKIEEQADAIALTLTVAAKQAAVRKLDSQAAEAAVERAVKPLNEELVELERMRAEVAAWQAEAEQAEQRAQSLADLADMARKRLHRLTPAEQAEVLALLGIKVTVTAFPRPRRPGEPPRMPAAIIKGEVDPRLFAEARIHLGERSPAESCLQVSSIIPFRMDMALRP